MKELEVWRFLHRELSQGHSAALLIVIDSQGSSPGRLGFKMAVAKDGQMVGSIGGGIMEHKLVAWAIDRLRDDIPFWEVRRQVHSKEAPHDQSGMICSGEQTIAMLRLSALHLPTAAQIVDSLIAGGKVLLDIHPSGFSASPQAPSIPKTSSTPKSITGWHYAELLGLHHIAHVIGAGHVGLEMCRLLAALDFYVINYDDRPQLNTFEANTFAHKKVVTPYANLEQLIQGGPNVYAIVMTFGYRGDDEAVRALLGKQFAYLGMMGSETKVDKLLSDLKRDGFSKDAISQLRTPAGLISHCKTPAEIAISIAAEMIQVRNENPK